MTCIHIDFNAALRGQSDVTILRVHALRPNRRNRDRIVIAARIVCSVMIWASSGASPPIWRAST